MPKFDVVTLFLVPLEEACCVERSRVFSSVVDQGGGGRRGGRGVVDAAQRYRACAVLRGLLNKC